MKRDQFIAKLSSDGTKAEHVSGQVWKISGKTVAIAYASERRPNRWFLGVAMDDYDAVVLICENSSHNVTTFVIPRDFCERHKNRFSRGSDGKQLKLNVALAYGRYTIVVPGEGAFAINQYIDRLEWLRLSLYRKHGAVVTECRNVTCSACLAIELGGLGNARSTLFRVPQSLPSDSHQAIARTRDTLKTLRQMAPDEDPLPRAES